MANYYETARTNYFRVKDEAAFRAFASKWKLELVQDKDGFALFPGQYSEDGFNLFDEDTEETLSLADELVPFLAEDSIAIVIGSGHEKHRYVSGYATAVNSKGDFVQINIDDIYDLAKAKFGIAPTRAEY